MAMRNLAILIFVITSFIGFSQNGFYKGWGLRGDVLGVGTLSLGSTDNFSFAVIVNGKTKMVFGGDAAGTPSVSTPGTFSCGTNFTATGNALITGTTQLTSSVNIGTAGVPSALLHVVTTTAGQGAIFGNARVGVWSDANTFMIIRHTSANESSGYALVQNSSGDTYLNSSGSTYLASASTVKALITANSMAMSTRFSKKQGADVASLAGAIALGTDGNVFEITGTNAITLITSTNWQNGAEITLLFTSTASLTDGVANSGSDIGFELAGNVNFNASADDSITLTLSEIGGTVRWREKCRSVN